MLTTLVQELSITPPSFRGLAGVARRDITPPVGINAAAFAAATQVTSEGAHRPLLATALVVQGRDNAPVVLVVLDHLELGDLVKDVTRWVEAALPATVVFDGSRVMIACTHTHSSPWFMSYRAAEAGGEYLHPYLDSVRAAVVEAVREAFQRMEPCTITWGSGRCDLAANRDLPDPDRPGDRYLVGFNPDRSADDTVVVGRVTRDLDHRVVATIVNYACHGTVLGPDNNLVSPDFVGGMREIVEGHLSSAPCIFLQGASGEMAPILQYSADTDLADSQGRRLGYSVLAVLEGLLAPGSELALTTILESGAPLAVWEPREFEPNETIQVMKIESAFPIKSLKGVDELSELIDDAPAHWAAERLVRQRGMSQAMEGEETRQVPAWLWRIGTAVFVGHPNESYSNLQTELRKAFPDLGVVVMNLVNDADVVAYIYPEELDGKDLYAVWQSPYGPGALGRLIDDCKGAIGQMMTS